MNKGLYIHIPFCKKICTYCDFTKKYVKFYDLDKYIEYLNKEICMYNISEVETIFIGGGTPSILTCEQIEKIKIPNVTKEFSIEMNPEDVTFNKLTSLKKIGVTRISMGVQTINEQILKACKRNHSFQDINKALDLFRKFDFDINLDFMYGFENEKIDDIIRNIKFIEKNIDIISHISYYNIILENNTILDNENYKFDELIDEKNYFLIIKELEKIGFQQYEISNFAKENNKCLHNLIYWQNNNYFGVGCGASGYVNNNRYKNTSSLENYYEKLDKNLLPIYEIEEIDEIDNVYEYIMLGLRLREGIEVKKIKDYDVNISKLELNNGFARIYFEDLFISNEIIISVTENL